MSTFEIISASIDFLLTVGLLYFLFTRVEVNVEIEKEINDK
jgi:hypothetical protein